MSEQYHVLPNHDYEGDGDVELGNKTSAFKPVKSSGHTSVGTIKDVDDDDATERSSDASELDIDLKDTKSVSQAGNGGNDLLGLTEDSTSIEKLVVITKQSFPVIVSFFLGLGGAFINLMFAGRFVPVPDDEVMHGDRSIIFAGVSLANMFVSVSCLSLLIGMSGAIETLGSQHNGAGNYREVGLVLQRSFAILTTMCLPIFVMWYFVYDLYRLLGVEHAVCVVVQRFIFIRALSVPCDVVNESYEKYAMSIGVVDPSMWGNITFNVLIFAFNCLFIFGFKLTYEWLAVSWVLASYLSFGLQLWLSKRHVAVQRTEIDWDWGAWQNWSEFISLGLPGTVMLCSEWWAFECLTIFSTFLGTAQVAAQTIIMQIASLAFMIPLGIGITCASFVGNAIGASEVPLAKQIGKLCLAYAAVINVLLGVLILFGGPAFVSIFTSHPVVRDVVESAIPFLSLFIMIDGLQGVASGVLRGAGKQVLGAVANVFAYYGFGLPMAWVICFQLHYGVDGLIMGLATGSLCQVSVLFVVIFCFETYLFSSSISNGNNDNNNDNNSNNNNNNKAPNRTTSRSRSSLYWCCCSCRSSLRGISSAINGTSTGRLDFLPVRMEDDDETAEGDESDDENCLGGTSLDVSLHNAQSRHDGAGYEDHFNYDQQLNSEENDGNYEVIQTHSSSSSSRQDVNVNRMGDAGTGDDFKRETNGVVLTARDFGIDVTVVHDDSEEEEERESEKREGEGEGEEDDILGSNHSSASSIDPFHTRSSSDNSIAMT